MFRARYRVPRVSSSEASEAPVPWNDPFPKHFVPKNVGVVLNGRTYIGHVVNGKSDERIKGRSFGRK